jgi:hypothetical protein
MKSTATKKKIAVSLFSGAGGFDLGYLIQKRYITQQQ